MFDFVCGTISVSNYLRIAAMKCLQIKGSIETEIATSKVGNVP